MNLHSVSPKVSIIIPVYNVERYIEKSILSALNQTYTNIEYLIIDDCSSDNSISIVSRIASEFPNKDIKIIHHESNKGSSVARNSGIDNALGEYIYFMDSDDVISQDCISVHISAIVQNDGDVSQANFNVIGGHNILYQASNVEILENEIILQAFFEKKLHPSGCNKLYRRTFLEKFHLRFVENLLFEDVQWAFDIATVSQKVIFIPNVTYDYIIHPNSNTTTLSITKVIQQYESLNYILLYIIKFYKNIYDKNIHNLIKHWIAEKRFKAIVRLLNLNLDDKIKDKYYDMYNTSELRQYSSGLYAILCLFPRPIFHFIFIIPYNIFLRIKKYI